MKIIYITILLLLISVIWVPASTAPRHINMGPNGIQKCIEHYGNGTICIDVETLIAEYMLKYPRQFSKLVESLKLCK